MRWTFPVTFYRISSLLNVYVAVQFNPWFNFYFLLFQTHYHKLPYTQKQKKIKIKPKIKLTHNIYALVKVKSKFQKDLIYLFSPKHPDLECYFAENSIALFLCPQGLHKMTVGQVQFSRNWKLHCEWQIL